MIDRINMLFIVFCSIAFCICISIDIFDACTPGSQGNKQWKVTRMSVHYGKETESLHNVSAINAYSSSDLKLVILVFFLHRP